MEIYWSILTGRGYPTKEDKLREEEEYLRQLEKIRLMLGAEKGSDKREEEFEVLVDSIKGLHEAVSIRRADCEKQIENAKANIKSAPTIIHISAVFLSRRARLSLRSQSRRVTILMVVAVELVSIVESRVQYTYVPLATNFLIGGKK